MKVMTPVVVAIFLLTVPIASVMGEQIVLPAVIHSAIETDRLQTRQWIGALPEAPFRSEVGWYWEANPWIAGKADTAELSFDFGHDLCWSMSLRDEVWVWHMLRAWAFLHVMTVIRNMIGIETHGLDQRFCLSFRINF